MTEAFARLLRILALTERMDCALICFCDAGEQPFSALVGNLLSGTLKLATIPVFVERNWLYSWLRLHPKFVPEPSFEKHLSAFMASALASSSSSSFMLLIRYIEALARSLQTLIAASVIFLGSCNA